MLDWSLAIRIASFGFLTVFAVLGVLSFTLWLVNLAVCKIIGGRGKAKSIHK
ncbi:MAG: hypothetical protein JXB43_00195 [Dehalococcoidia bacterium]|nr:hypothetical protein [Dehalococcoidia bacterium]